MKISANEIDESTPWEAWRPVSTIMRTTIPKVSAECTREALLAIFAGLGVEHVLVVDHEGRAKGVVSWGCLAGDAVTAADAIQSFAFTLDQSIPISLAAALMASAGVLHVPIVSGAQDAVGLLSAIDVLAWVARQAGHRVGEPNARIRSKPDTNEPRQR